MGAIKTIFFPIFLSSFFAKTKSLLNPKTKIPAAAAAARSTADEMASPEISPACEYWEYMLCRNVGRLALSDTAQCILPKYSTRTPSVRPLGLNRMPQSDISGPTAIM